MSLLGQVRHMADVERGWFRRVMAGEDAPKATYDLGRLCRNGLLSRDPGAHRYRLTSRGRRIATLFTRVAARVVVPALTQLSDLT